MDHPERRLYRGVLREADILSCDQGGNGQVSFGYRDSSSGKIQVGTPSGADFLHPNKKGLIALLHLVLRITPLKRPAGRNTPAGVSLPLLRQANAGDPAAHRPQRRPTALGRKTGKDARPGGKIA